MKNLLIPVLLGLYPLLATAQPILCGHRGSLWGVENTEEAFIACSMRWMCNEKSSTSTCYTYIPKWINGGFQIDN